MHKQPTQTHFLSQTHKSHRAISPAAGHKIGNRAKVERDRNTTAQGACDSPCNGEALLPGGPIRSEPVGMPILVEHI